jgi:putative addiction module component (TIGR02574 family)
METESILKEALAKPQADRALIAQRLIASLDPPGEDDVDVEAAWQEEIERRLQEIDSGKAQMIPWETVRDDIRGRLRGRR